MLAALRYEAGRILAHDEFGIVHGRFSGTGQPRNWIAADIVRIADAVLVEHWDVLQDQAQGKSRRAGGRCSALSSRPRRNKPQRAAASGGPPFSTASP